MENSRKLQKTKLEFVSIYIVLITIYTVLGIISSLEMIWASLVAQTVKNLPAVRETWVQSLGWEDPLEEGMATHSSILAWTISWTKEPGQLQFMGLQRVGHSWIDLACISKWGWLGIFLSFYHAYLLWYLGYTLYKWEVFAHRLFPGRVYVRLVFPKCLVKSSRPASSLSI